MNPSDLIEAYADLAETHPLSMLSPGGAALQKAFVAFLRASTTAAPADVTQDLHALVARTSIALSIAFAGGVISRRLIDKQTFDLLTSIKTELHAQRRALIANDERNPDDGRID